MITPDNGDDTFFCDQIKYNTFNKQLIKIHYFKFLKSLFSYQPTLFVIGISFGISWEYKAIFYVTGSKESNLIFLKMRYSKFQIYLEFFFISAILEIMCVQKQTQTHTHYSTFMFKLLFRSLCLLAITFTYPLCQPVNYSSLEIKNVVTLFYQHIKNTNWNYVP